MNDNSGNNLFLWVLGGLASCIGVVLGHIYHLIMTGEERSRLEISKVSAQARADAQVAELVARSGDTAIWSEMSRQLDISRQFRESILTTMMTKEDAGEIKADLAEIKKQILEIIKSSRKIGG